MPLQCDTSHRIAIKVALEEILGREAWYELKESTSLIPWRQNVLKAFKAIRISIAATISIRDEDWAKEIEENLDRGEEGVRCSKDIDELLSHFEATLLRQVFLQIGFAPNFQGKTGQPLRKENWKLDAVRTVQYIQSPQQIEAKFWSDQQRRIGPQKQMALRDEYRLSNRKIPYSLWCREQET